MAAKIEGVSDVNVGGNAESIVEGIPNAVSGSDAPAYELYGLMIVRQTGSFFMFRRIELFDEMSEEHYRQFIEAVRQSIDDPDYPVEKENPRFRKSGLVGFGSPVVWDAWLQMNSPRRPVNRNVRFYFTEDGWRRYGRKTIKVCQQAGQRYRVLRIKENEVDVIYRDEFQVAVRPKRKFRD